jgi:hypothetical protein
MTANLPNQQQGDDKKTAIFSFKFIKSKGRGSVICKKKHFIQ